MWASSIPQHRPSEIFKPHDPNHRDAAELAGRATGDLVDLAFNQEVLDDNPHYKENKHTGAREEYRNTRALVPRLMTNLFGGKESEDYTSPDAVGGTATPGTGRKVDQELSEARLPEDRPGTSVDFTEGED